MSVILDNLIERSFTVTVDDNDAIYVHPAIHPRWAARITKQKSEFIRVYRDRVNVGVGNELSKIIPKWFARKKCGCKELAQRLNLLGIEWCERRQHEIVKMLVHRSRCYLLARLFPSLTKRVVESWVSTAIERVKAHGLQRNTIELD